MWRALGFVAAAVAGSAAAALGYRAWRQADAARRLAITGPQGIDEAGFVSIGEIPQWVSVRGEDRRNPVLVIAHGGPGNAMAAMAYEVLRPWEAHFTVVHWDQRGAGLTFSRGGPNGQGELSIDRISRDGLEVVEHALTRVGQTKAILLGGSWGSILGVAMARMRPDLFHAYVGTGQVVSGEANEAVGYTSLLAKLQAAGAADDVAALTRIGPPPYTDLKQMIAERRILMRHPPASERGLMGRLMHALLFAPWLTPKQVYDYLAAGMFSLRSLIPALLAYADPKPYAQFEIPVVLIQGAEDIQTPTSLVEAYFAEIAAPAKALVLLPGGGHTALAAMPDAFLAALLTHAAPFARPSSASGFG